MLRPDSSRELDLDYEYEEVNEPDEFAPKSSASNNARPKSIDIQRELDLLEEMILDSPRVLKRTLVDEDKLIDRLDLIRLNLPAAFREAEAIVRHKDEIFRQAEQYIKDAIDAAERRADEILDELGIIRRTETEAQQIRQRVQEECEAFQKQTLTEIAGMRIQAQQEIERMHQLALAEREDIQHQADEYADRVLRNMEQQLGEILRVIRNGRQQLQKDRPSWRYVPAEHAARTPNLDMGTSADTPSPLELDNKGSGGQQDKSTRKPRDRGTLGKKRDSSSQGKPADKTTKAQAKPADKEDKGAEEQRGSEGVRE
jgi:F0F1-type ATP synthase membrane subunit b/b'